MFLISLKAGGFGLNLTEADYCFLLDPWWNPGDRGAGRRPHPPHRPDPSHGLPLIVDRTIEEKVMALKARKAELSPR